mmetsp:Transcript_25826/g.80864  ORF Transcript_25826/g.80864 Transcript_25826/m.80864 type:complete len:261 (-) Transcript_25826:689-1471(-)
MRAHGAQKRQSHLGTIFQQCRWETDTKPRRDSTTLLRLKLRYAYAMKSAKSLRSFSISYSTTCGDTTCAWLGGPLSDGRPLCRLAREALAFFFFPACNALLRMSARCRLYRVTWSGNRVVRLVPHLDISRSCDWRRRRHSSTFCRSAPYASVSGRSISLIIFAAVVLRAFFLSQLRLWRTSSGSCVCTRGFAFSTRLLCISWCAYSSLRPNQVWLRRCVSVADDSVNVGMVSVLYSPSIVRRGPIGAVPGRWKLSATGKP